MYRLQDCRKTHYGKLHTPKLYTLVYVLVQNLDRNGDRCSYDFNTPPLFFQSISRLFHHHERPHTFYSSGMAMLTCMVRVMESASVASVGNHSTGQVTDIPCYATHSGHSNAGMRSSVAAAWLLLLLPMQSVNAVNEHDFKKCHQSAFCRRGRALADRAAESVKSGEKWKSPYSLDPSTIVLEDGGSRFTGRVRSSLNPEIKFELDVRVHEDGVVRVKMDEKEGLRKRYDEAASWALLKEPVLSSSAKWSLGKEVKVVYGGKKDQVEVTVEFEPLVVRMKRNGKDQVVLNGQGLLHMEHFRQRVERVEAKDGEVPVAGGDETQKVIQLPPNGWFEGDIEDGWWEESWKTWTDTKPKGALS
jgi:hypothetical protein